jgi:hypothetical protein
MSLRVRRWNKDDNIDSDSDETKSKRKGKDSTDGLSRNACEFGGVFGICFWVVFTLVLCFGSQLLIRSVS